MADVTGGTPPSGTSTFDVPADIKKVYDHFGDTSMFSVANATALPSSGNWPGRLLMARDTGVLYRCTALPGTWKAVTRIAGTVSPGAGLVLASPSFVAKDGDGFVSGLLSVSASGTIAHAATVATLPSGFRPPVDVSLPGMTTLPGNAAITHFLVAQSGVVTVFGPVSGANAAFLSFGFKV